MDMETTPSQQAPVLNRWQRRAAAREQRALRRLQRSQLRAQAVPAPQQAAPQPTQQPPVQAKAPRRKRGGCGGCRAARKAMAERKRLKEISMTREDWLKAKSDIERDIGLTEVKIVEHRNYQGPCPKCIRKTLRMLRRSIRSLQARKLEIEERIASLPNS